MQPRPERIRWLDALRGAAVLAIIPLNARWLLHPADAYHDPTVVGDRGIAAWTWWAVPELFFDHSTLFLLAAVFGISLSAAHLGDFDPGWTRRHRARIFGMAAIGFAHGALIWPGDILWTYAVTALLLTGAIRQVERDSNGLLWTAAGCAAIPPVLGLLTLYEVTTGYATAGLDPTTTYQLATDEFRAWESAQYGGSFLDTLEVKWLQWVPQATTTMGVWSMWHAAGGMLAGLWWHRRGRHICKNLSGLAWVLGTAGLALTSASLAIAAADGYHPITLSWTNWVTYTGGALLAACATVAFTNIAPTAWNAPIGQWLQACGRTSLSIYLLANLLLAGVAQGWGLGLHGRLDGEQTAATTLAVMATLSWLATRYTETGPRRPPAERLWRVTTRLLSGGRPRRERRTA